MADLPAPARTIPLCSETVYRLPCLGVAQHRWCWRTRTWWWARPVWQHADDRGPLPTDWLWLHEAADARDWSRSAGWAMALAFAAVAVALAFFIPA